MLGQFFSLLNKIDQKLFLKLRFSTSVLVNYKNEPRLDTFVKGDAMQIDPPLDLILRPMYVEIILTLERFDGFNR